MTIKKGQVQVVTNISETHTRTQVYNIVEKTEGAYVETLTELVSMEVVFNDGTGNFVIDSASELGQGFKIFPMVTAIDKVVSFKGSAADVVTWPVAFAEVS